MSDAQRIRDHLCARVSWARQRGHKRVVFRAGDIHAAVGLHQQMPNVCQVLRGRRFHEQCGVVPLRVLERPPCGDGANLVMEFRVLPHSGRRT